MERRGRGFELLGGFCSRVVFLLGVGFGGRGGEGLLKYIDGEDKEIQDHGGKIHKIWGAI